MTEKSTLLRAHPRKMFRIFQHIQFWVLIKNCHRTELVSLSGPSSSNCIFNLSHIVPCPDFAMAPFDVLWPSEIGKSQAWLLKPLIIIAWYYVEISVERDLLKTSPSNFNLHNAWQQQQFSNKSQQISILTNTGGPRGFETRHFSSCTGQAKRQNAICHKIAKLILSISRNFYI